MTYTENTSQRFPIYFFAPGEPYEFWGIFPTDIHLFTTDGAPIMLFGTDRLARDLFSRTIYGSRISLSIGLVGVALAFFLGLTIGGISGYFGGTVDIIIQRIIEFILSLPTIPLWMALSASLPRVVACAEDLLLHHHYPLAPVLVHPGAAGTRQAPFTARRGFRRIGTAGGFRWLADHPRAFVSILHQPSHRNADLDDSCRDSGRNRPQFPGSRHAAARGELGGPIAGCAEHRDDYASPWPLVPVLFVIATVLMYNFLGDGLHRCCRSVFGLTREDDPCKMSYRFWKSALKTYFFFDEGISAPWTSSP